jgi:hypothetical protein
MGQLRSTCTAPTVEAAGAIARKHGDDDDERWREHGEHAEAET